jgi:hypothetical protein
MAFWGGERTVFGMKGEWRRLIAVYNTTVWISSSKERRKSINLDTKEKTELKSKLFSYFQ